MKKRTKWNIWIFLIVVNLTNGFSQSSHIIYGQNFQPGTNGKFIKINLGFDFYPGRTDRLMPPVIIIHGGHFLEPETNELTWGDAKDSCIVYLAQQLNAIGLPVLVPTFRTGLETDKPLKESYVRAVYRGSQDIHALIRFIKTSPKELRQQSIDSSNIILWGFESGGIVAAACANATRNLEWLAPELVKADSSGPIIDTRELGNPLGTSFGLKGKDTLNTPLYSGTSEVSIWVAVGGGILSASWVRFTSPINLLFHVPTDPIIPFRLGKIVLPKGYDQVTEVYGSKKTNEFYQSLVKYDLWDRANFNDPISQLARQRNDGHEGLFIFNTRTAVDHTPWNWADSAFWIKIQHPTCEPIPPPVCSYYLNALFTNPDMSGQKGRAYIDTMLTFFKPRLDLLFGTRTGIIRPVQNKQVFKIFPNPSRNTIYLEGSENAEFNTIQWTIYNYNGVKMTESTFVNADKMAIDLSPQLSNGMYFIRLKYGHHTETHKLIIIQK